MIAGKLGLGGSFITPALGYVIPKLIGMLTPDKTVPSTIPANVEELPRVIDCAVAGVRRASPQGGGV